ncbi:MAG: gliding motility-associated ABC transporter ATP-binding subunit GldA [Saprospiraceae bacterium]|nr:gliding motility-associated ABC transporter ATP-binding subunit GldA [Saprospiraceae bacterium]
MSILVKNLEKRYGEQKALAGINFSIDSGEIVGLLGPNGAGKTTTMKILSGFMDVYDGEASINGLDVHKSPLEIKQLIGYLPEHNPLYLDMYVREYLTFIASIYRLDKVKERVSNIIDLTGLKAEQHKLIKALSKGYRQRVGLAQALIHDPEILILDEPTTGLDPNQLVEIRQLIKNIGAEKTIVFSSHIMQEVQAICDRVIILNRGVLVADDKIDYLDQALNKQREILLELDKSLEVDWVLHDLQEVIPIGNHQYRLIFNKTDKDPRPEIFDFIVERQCKLLQMVERKSTMEDVFQKMTLG